MSTPPESFHLLRCENLFELANAKELGIPPEVVAFLKAANFPWNALGKALTEFVRQTIAAIPAEQRHAGTISPHAVLENPDDIVVCEGAIIEPHAFVSGPTFLAPGAIVRHGAYVRGSVYACSGSVIGHTSELKGAIMLPKAKAAHFAYVGDSILGVDTNLGAGTKLANLRLDHGLVPIVFGETREATNLKKFGAIFGNRAQTGCNSVTNPGTILLPDTFMLPNSTGRGVIERKLPRH